MLKTLNIENFTCFPKAELTFSKGLNVIVGENGTGKSHLLKLGYTVLRAKDIFQELQHEKVSVKLTPINNDANIVNVKNLDNEEKFVFKFTELLDKYFKTSASIDLLDKFSSNTKYLIEACFSKDGCLNIAFETDFEADEEMLSDYTPLVSINLSKILLDDKKSNSLFLPAKEILSIYESFRSTLKKRELGFDKTYEDFAEALDVALLRNIEDEKIKKSIELLENSINDFAVEYDSKIFSFRKKTNKPNGQSNTVIPATLFAEGHNKLGTLSYLMRNGSIQEGMTFFWDEPEANMNPRLLKILAKLLVDMSSYMQIVLSTHSLFLLRELEILQEKKELKEARYFGLHFREDGMGVEVQQGNTSNEIGNIVALDEDLYQADKYLEVLNGE